MVENKPDSIQISVIIPTYNRRNTLERSVQSVLNQTYTNLELLIIDDGSDDGTKEYVQGIADSRVRYYQNEHNIGPAAARNRGVDLAKGDYIAFQDSDDEWLPDKLEKLTDALLYHNPDGAVMAFHRMVEDMGGGRSIVPSKELMPDENTTDIFQRMLLYPIVSPQTIVIRKDCFQKLGGFYEKLQSLEDYEFFLRVARQYRILFVDEPLVIIYDSPDSVNKRWYDKINTELYVINEMYDELCRYDSLQAKVNLVRLQAENYDCEAYFYEQLLQLTEYMESSEPDKAAAIRNCMRLAAEEGRQTGTTDRAAYYQNAAGQMERMVAGLTKLRENIRKNPTVLKQNKAAIGQVLAEVVEDLQAYADLAFYPDREKQILEELKKQMEDSSDMAKVLTEVCGKAQELLEQIAAPGCTCAACGSKVRLLPRSPYAKVMREHYGYTREDVCYLFEEEKDGCPVCGASQEIRFLLGFLQNISPEENERLRIGCVTSERWKSEQGSGWPEWVQRFAAATDEADYIWSDCLQEAAANGEQDRKDALADVIICTDALLQTADDSALFKRIHQMLANQGIVIVMLPALLTMTGKSSGETDREESCEESDGEGAVWQQFGLEVHRLYSERAFLKKTQEAGFTVSIIDREWFGDEYYEQYGFGSHAKLYLLTASKS
jgi:glycosyltransferase involved in cell wall biosynthesis